MSIVIQFLFIVSGVSTMLWYKERGYLADLWSWFFYSTYVLGSQFLPPGLHGNPPCLLNHLDLT